jgi:Helix-turn-helix domain
VLGKVLSASVSLAHHLSAFDRSGEKALKRREVKWWRGSIGPLLERAMKVQEVIMRAMAKQITWWQAGEILGVTPRTIRRMKRNWKRAGSNGLYDHRHHRPSPKRVPVKTLEKVLELYRETACLHCLLASRFALTSAAKLRANSPAIFCS